MSITTYISIIIRDTFDIFDVLVSGDAEAREGGVSDVILNVRDIIGSGSYMHSIADEEMKQDSARASLVVTALCVCRALLFVVLHQIRFNLGILVGKDILKKNRKNHARFICTVCTRRIR